MDFCNFAIEYIKALGDRSLCPNQEDAIFKTLSHYGGPHFPKSTYSMLENHQIIEIIEKAMEHMPKIDRYDLDYLDKKSYQRPTEKTPMINVTKENDKYWIRRRRAKKGIPKKYSVNTIEEARDIVKKPILENYTCPAHESTYDSVETGGYDNYSLPIFRSIFSVYYDLEHIWLCIKKPNDISFAQFRDKSRDWIEEVNFSINQYGGYHVRYMVPSYFLKKCIRDSECLLYTQIKAFPSIVNRLLENDLNHPILRVECVYYPEDYNSEDFEWSDDSD